MNKRKTTSIALVAAVAISTVQLAYPADVFAHEQVNETSISEKYNYSKDISKTVLANAVEVGDEATLIEKLNNSSTDEKNPTIISLKNSIAITKQLEIKDGTYVKINGNGNSIYRDDEYINENPNTAISLIVINGVLDTENVTLDAKCDENINGFRVVEVKGTYNMYENTTIQNGYLPNGGGANVLISSENGVFNMNGGLITKGHGVNAGGVFVYGSDKGGTFNMYGGEISNNVGTNYGSAVVVYHGGQKANLYNGKIINNESTGERMGSNFYGGALYINSKDGTYISGDVEMYGNKTKYKDKNEYENVDIFCTSGTNGQSYPNIISKLNHKLNIYVAEDGNINHNILTKGSNKEGYKYTLTNEDLSMINTFSIMDKTYAIVLDGKENAIKYVEGVNVTFKKNDGTEESYTKAVEKNKEVSIPSNEFTREGYVFLGWSKKQNGEVVDKITADKDLELYAKWAKIDDYEIEYGTNKKISLGEDINISDYESSNTEVATVDTDGNITTKGVGETTISYNVNVANEKPQKVTFTLTVTKPSGTVAMIGKVPYTSLVDAVAVAEGKTIEVETEENGDAIEIKLDSALVIDKPMTINFNRTTLSKKATESNPSTKASYDNCLIKITSEGVIIQNANFDLSNGEEVAILVDGSNAASNVTLGGAVKASRQSTAGTEVEAPVVKMVGGDSGVTIKENATVNGTSNPSNGTADKVDIIVGTGASASNITNNNKTSGGGGNYIPSKPTYTHEEIIGSDRYDTAAKIADKLGSYDNIVLVNAESSMSDGLSASGLAGKENGAILLTKKDSIPKATMDRIKKVKKVYIIGGEAAISAKVANEITAAGIKVERLGGKDRVETSEIVAKKLGNYSYAFVVNGFKGEADAMSASAIAAKKGAPILLTNGKTSTHAKKSGVEYYVIGGNSVVDKSIADKYNAEVLAGKDRYATNKEVINEFYSGSDKVYIANGDKLVDALTASPLAKKDGIVLVNEKSDKSILKGKDTVQVGGMDFKIEFEK